MKRRVSLFLVLVFVLSMCAAPVSAMEARASNLIKTCNASITEKSSGDLKISFSLSTYDATEKIGVTFINLYCNGTLVKTFYSNDYSSMMGSGGTKYSGSVTYSDPDSGAYYAYVRFYAETSSVNDAESYYTDDYTI